MARKNARMDNKDMSIRRPAVRLAAERKTMPHYLLSVCYPAGAVPPPDSELATITRELKAVNLDMQTKGVWVFGGALFAPDTATVVRTANGEVLTTDGPFIETKEQIGGIAVIRTADLGEAQSWAARLSAVIRVPIEVRQMQAH
jgi:hypothetical protein